jgi:ParB-like nuclease family protein
MTTAIKGTPTKAKDEQIEEWLTSHGVSFEPKAILIDGINRNKSHKNQSRFVALDETWVLTIAEAMERGDVFPPIVVWKDKGSYIVADGNHRVEGATVNGYTEIDAYVIEEATQRQIQVLTFEANAKHGLPASHEERMAHGVYLSELGVEQKRAAAMVNVPAAQLQKAVALSRADARARTLGIERWDSISAWSRSRLTNLRSDVVFGAAARLVIEAGLLGNQIETLVTTVNKESTETAQLAVIDGTRKTQMPVIKNTAGGRLPIPTDLTRLYRAVTYAENVDQATLNAAKSALTDDQRGLLSERISKSVVLLMNAKRTLDA